MKHFTRPRLMTSNPKKIAEFKRLGIDVDIGEPSADLEEPLSTPHFVAAHKAFMSGDNALCEDTRLDVEGAQVGIEARFLMDELPKLAGRRATFACCLALSREGQCFVWEGSIEGFLADKRGPDGFGFDPFFSPDGGAGLRLSELGELGRKDEFSARARACSLFSNSEPIAIFSHADLAAFNGPWQGGSEHGDAANQAPTPPASTELDRLKF